MKSQKVSNTPEVYKGYQEFLRSSGRFLGCYNGSQGISVGARDVSEFFRGFMGRSRKLHGGQRRSRGLQGLFRDAPKRLRGCPVRDVPKGLKKLQFVSWVLEAHHSVSGCFKSIIGSFMGFQADPGVATRVFQGVS